MGKKGRGVRVVGRLKQDRWTGTDGKPRSKIAIVAEHVEFRPEFKKDQEKITVEAAEAPDGFPEEDELEEVAVEETGAVLAEVAF